MKCNQMSIKNKVTGCFKNALTNPVDSSAHRMMQSLSACIILHLKLKTLPHLSIVQTKHLYAFAFSVKPTLGLSFCKET
jgi:hypothetical protein